MGYASDGNAIRKLLRKSHQATPGISIKTSMIAISILLIVSGIVLGSLIMAAQVTLALVGSNDSTWTNPLIPLAVMLVTMSSGMAMLLIGLLAATNG